MDEVRLLTGETDPVSGAEAICRLGARNALVTSGAEAR